MRQPRQTHVTIVALLLLTLFTGLFVGYRIGADAGRRDNARDQEIRPEVVSQPSPGSPFKAAS